MALPNTHFGPDAIAELLEGTPGGKNLFFDGIGGISMNSLAHISALLGHHVSGYDRSPTSITRRLEQTGITVYYEADAVHMQGCDALIYTVAMGEDNPEYRYAGVHEIPRISRADYLGYIMSRYEKRIGISGTHGKSTTTGMVARILSWAGTDPTVFNGAEMKETGTVDRIGSERFFAFEACEYMDSFLDFYPTIAVVLNIELDHVDYFPSLEAIKCSFTNFMNRTGPEGYAIVNANDPDCLEAAQGYKGHLVTFGNRNPLADYWSQSITMDKGRASFDVMHGQEKLATVHLQIPGKHNISDALAAFAACHLCGLDPRVIAEGLGAYEGICRRMDHIGDTAEGAAVYTDYAHHPTEIEATLSGAAAMGYDRLTVVFQPHTYSRTAELFRNFVTALADSAADEIILCDIYAARETNTYGVTSHKLAEAVQSRGKKCRCAGDFPAAAAMARDVTPKDGMVLVMGAGDVIKVGEHLLG